MFDDDWVLESKEVSPLGEELSLFDRPNEVKRGRILEAHRLESILQQQISQRMAPSHHDVIDTLLTTKLPSDQMIPSFPSALGVLDACLFLFQALSLCHDLIHLAEVVSSMVQIERSSALLLSRLSPT
ncbi:hypothetical protein Tco_1306228 [Tanacetum coccineum]